MGSVGAQYTGRDVWTQAPQVPESGSDSLPQSGSFEFHPSLTPRPGGGRGPESPTSDSSWMSSSSGPLDDSGPPTEVLRRNGQRTETPSGVPTLGRTVGSSRGPLRGAPIVHSDSLSTPTPEGHVGRDRRTPAPSRGGGDPDRERHKVPPLRSSPSPPTVTQTLARRRR